MAHKQSTAWRHPGRTPLPPLRLPIGSWIFVASAKGRSPARALAVVRRGEAAKAEALMFEGGEVPEGFLTVGAGIGLATCRRIIEGR